MFLYLFSFSYQYTITYFTYFSWPLPARSHYPFYIIVGHYQLQSLYSHDFVFHHFWKSTTPNKPLSTTIGWRYHSKYSIFLATTNKEKLPHSYLTTTEWRPKPPQTLTRAMFSVIFILDSKENYTTQHQNIIYSHNGKSYHQKHCI